MGVLKVGDTVKMKYGGEAMVLAELGTGGQGTVYKVSYNGKEYALKQFSLFLQYINHCLNFMNIQPTTSAEFQ